MPHPLQLELLVQEQQRDLQREREHIHLLALVPKSPSLARLVAMIGTNLVSLGTWMQSADLKSA